MGFYQQPICVDYYSMESRGELLNSRQSSEYLSRAYNLQYQMGNQGGKRQINPNVEDNKAVQQSDQFQRYIQEAFKKASTNGVLTKDKFNQTLAVLEASKIKRLRDTPLAERLFVLFDKGRAGTISEGDFSRGLSEILNDKNNAVMYSFRAFDADMDNRISRREFVTFIEESWKAAFRILGEMVENHKRETRLTLGDVSNWSNNKISYLNEQSTKIFNALDAKKTGFIEYVVFKDWVLTSPISSIKAELAGMEIEVPIHLIKILKE